MKPKSDDLSIALEELRNRPIVTESRDYARQWERSYARASSLRSTIFGAAGAIAAACVTACVVFGLLPMTVNPSVKNPIETGIAETRAIALDDGSRIVLDTSSRLRVAFTAAARDIELVNGRAHFEVAKDVHRPFRVRAGSAEVVAVGTVFDVAALQARTTVTLIEGRVNVLAITGTQNGESLVETLSPGQELGIATDGHILGKTRVKIETATAWQRGNLVLDDMPLRDALAEINRYSATKIIVSDPQLLSRRVSGTFRTGDIDTAALALAGYFGLQSSSRSDGTIALERP